MSKDGTLKNKCSYHENYTEKQWKIEYENEDDTFFFLNSESPVTIFITSSGM